MTCKTCEQARHSPSGKVCCALINDAKRLGVPEIADEETVVAAVNKIIPRGLTIYQGWAFPNRRYGAENSGTVGEGLMVNYLMLLDPDAMCSRFEPFGSEVQP